MEKRALSLIISSSCSPKSRWKSSPNCPAFDNIEGGPLFCAPIKFQDYYQYGISRMSQGSALAIFLKLQKRLMSRRPNFEPLIERSEGSKSKCEEKQLQAVTMLHGLWEELTRSISQSLPQYKYNVTPQQTSSFADLKLCYWHLSLPKPYSKKHMEALGNFFPATSECCGSNWF